MSKKKNNYSAEFKTKVVMELQTGQKSLNEVAAQYHIAPSTLSGWNSQFQERAADIFRRGPDKKDKVIEKQEKEIEVLQKKVGQLVIESDWLKKKSDEIFGPQGAHRQRRPEK